MQYLHGQFTTEAMAAEVKLWLLRYLIRGQQHVIFATSALGQGLNDQPHDILW